MEMMSIPVHFQVLGTETSVVLCLAGIANPTAMEAVLNGSYELIQEQLLASGDGQLLREVDGFCYNLNKRAFFTCKSASGQH